MFHLATSSEQVGTNRSDELDQYKFVLITDPNHITTLAIRRKKGSLHCIVFPINITVRSQEEISYYSSVFKHVLSQFINVRILKTSFGYSNYIWIK